MAEALDRIAPMIAGESKNRPVELNFEASNLLLSTRSDAGNAAEPVALTVEKPDPLFEEGFQTVTRVNHEFLLDFFRDVAGGHNQGRRAPRHRCCWWPRARACC